MTLVYRHGKKLKAVRCHRCSADFAAIIKREGPRWALHLSCGHVKTAGWTMPPEELRRRKLVETQTPIDPRAVSNKRQEQEDKERERLEREAYERRKENLTRSKYL